MDAVRRYCGYTPMAITPPDQNAIMLNKLAGGKVFVTFNHAANTQLRDDKGRDWFQYQAQDPSVKATFLLHASKPKTSYQITDLITGQKWQTSSDAQGYINVINDGWNMRGVAVEEIKPGQGSCAA